MFYISCFVFIATFVLGLWFGSVLPLFTDQTFPTILLLVFVPTVFFTLTAHPVTVVKATIGALQKSEPNAQAQAVLRSCGNIALLIGMAVTLINIMSLAYNWHSSVTSTYLGAAIATAVMSTLIGLVIKICCVAGSYRVQMHEG